MKEICSQYPFNNISIINNEEIYQKVINEILKNYSASEGKELLIKGEDNFVYQITTTDNDKNTLNGNKNNTYNNVSKIDLGYCENILKEYNNIESNISLIMIKFEKITNISKERILQYEIYEPYNKTKLNLSLCDNTTISIYSPVILSNKLTQLYKEIENMGYDLFDINSAFYQDICIPFKSPNGTDVLLADRISYYFHNNETICQSNCKMSNYSFESQYLKCDCDTSNSQIITRDINKFTPKTIYKSFEDTLKFSNYKVLLCYKLPFRIKSITTNIGSIIVIIIFIIYLIFLIIFCFKGITQFKSYFNNGINNNNIESIIKNNKKLNAYNKNSKNKHHIHPNKSSSRKKFNIVIFPPKKKSFSSKNKSSKNNFFINISRNSSQQNIGDYSSKVNQIVPLRQSSEIYNTTKKVNKNKVNYKILEKIKKHNEEETKNNKKSFFKIYWSILRMKHIILFTFFVRNDYNIIYIKFERFIFSIATYMALNVFFFADETMHKIHLDYGKYNFLQQIPQLIFSTIASQLIDILARYFGLTEKHYYEIKKLKENIEYKTKSIVNCIKVKIIIFFVFTFLMLIFYWYTIACFCSVYENTQIIFIKDSISSFALGLLYPFLLYLALAVFKFITSNKTLKKSSFENK